MVLIFMEKLKNTGGVHISQYHQFQYVHGEQERFVINVDVFHSPL